MMSEYSRKYMDISNYDTRKTSFMSIKDRSSSRFQNGGNSEDYEIRNKLFDYIYCRKKLYSIPGYELEIQFFVSEQIL